MSLHIECEAGKLLKAAQAILPAVTGKSTLPVLNHTLMEASSDGSLRLSGTDLEMGVRVVTEADVKGAGTAAPEAKMLVSLLSRLPSKATVCLKATEGDRMALTCLKSSYVLNAVNPEDFPEWPQAKEGERSTCFEMDGPELLSCIEQTSYAISTDKTRSILCGVYLMVKEGVSIWAATDTHRLAKRTGALTRSEGAGSVILPAPYVAAVKGYLGKESVSVEFTDRVCWMRSESARIEIFTKVIEGQFPNYERVIPSQQYAQVVFDVEEMQQAVQRVQLVAQHHIDKMALTPSGLFLQITAQGNGQTAHEEVICSIEGEPPTIGMNAKYLLSVLATLQGKEAILTFQSNELKPMCLFQKGEGELPDPSLTVVLMPMNLQQ